MAFRFNHIHFKSPDPKKTAQWYVDFFGAKIVSEGQNANGPTFRLDLHGMPLNVTPFLPGQSSERQMYGLEHVAVDTDNYAVDVEKIKNSGTKVLEETVLPDGRNICFFEGPEGVQVEFLEMR